MIKRIVFLVAYPFNLRDYERFGIELLQRNGFKVEVWDLSRILYPEFTKEFSPPDSFSYEGVSVFSDRRLMEKPLSTLSSSDFVVLLISYTLKSLWLYRAISRSNALYAVCPANALPYVKHTRPEEFIKKLRGLMQANPVGTAMQLVFQRLPVMWFGVRQADFVLAGGEKSVSNIKSVSRMPEIIWAHTFDYDIYLELINRPSSAQEGYAVFLDDNLCHDPCFMAWGISYADPPEVYYAQLRRFFDLLEKRTGKEVVIAAHPRSSYDKQPDWFGGRKLTKGKTAELVRGASFVLLQGSTSINYAVLFQKPIIFITTAALKKLYYGLLGQEMARAFDKKPVNIDEDYEIDLEHELTVNQQAYQSYKENYIKTCNSSELPFWQIVADRLKQL